MAANSNAIRGFVKLQKRFLNQVRSTSDWPQPLVAFRRKVHTAGAYDKNIDEHVRPVMVPDELVQEKTEYWAPHPHTGVFGPDSGPTSIVGAHNTAAVTAGGSESPALEQKAFFRATENLDKPQHP